MAMKNATKKVTKKPTSDTTLPAEYRQIHRFNNCRNRDHAKLYGQDAFYDLDLKDAEAAARLRPGDLCIVAHEPTPDRVRFTWHKFVRLRSTKDEQWDVYVYVLCGTLEKEGSLSKAEAPSNKYYQHFFEPNAHFKRRAAITP